MAVADQVQVEDVGMCEEVQRDLNSRSYTAGRFSVKRENGGYYFHQMLGRAVTGERASEAGRSLVKPHRPFRSRCTADAVSPRKGGLRWATNRRRGSGPV